LKGLAAFVGGSDNQELMMDENFLDDYVRKEIKQRE